VSLEAAPPGGVLFSRHGCPLCFVLERQARRASRRTGVPVRVVDVDTDEGLRARYGSEVPVLELPGERAIQGKASPREILAAFERAAARGSGGPRRARALPGWLRRILDRERPGREGRRS
jgi:glutaredoxin-like protein DUF836